MFLQELGDDFVLLLELLFQHFDFGEIGILLPFDIGRVGLPLKDDRSVAFSSDGSRVVAGTENRLLMVWSLSGHDARVIHQATEGMTRDRFLMDGVATAGADGSVKIWNGTPLAETPTYEPLPEN